MSIFHLNNQRAFHRTFPRVLSEMLPVKIRNHFAAFIKQSSLSLANILVVKIYMLGVSASIIITRKNR